ncbi:hypothetical protein [Microbacterium sp. AK031]|uniref:hypothetical protein n=1 Tax=Microbacterium sp. AK031 TaxID=2723076 RepID=UPI0021681747|nr:hypothetical protein [Microbacterium sp. AK031]MCS3844787.1 hypothetical protein [Microbacterium sp. AK031]
MATTTCNAGPYTAVEKSALAKLYPTEVMGFHRRRHGNATIKRNEWATVDVAGVPTRGVLVTFSCGHQHFTPHTPSI